MVERYKMKGKVLQKWKEMSICGNLIPDSQNSSLFFPFKTPYDNNYILEEDQFTSVMCCELFYLKEIDVGLVVDLTGTDRYYDKTVLEDKKIQHFKIPWIEWDNFPTREETTLFNAKCMSFRKQNPKKVIGVHCHSGLNRTGFFICTYMIEVEKMHIDNAIDLFTKCRPPGFENYCFIDELIRRYNVPYLLKRITTLAGHKKSNI